MRIFKILSVLIVFLLFSTLGFSLRLEKLQKKDTAPKIELISPKKDQTIDNPNIVIVAKITDDKQVSSVRVNFRLINIVPGTEIKIQEPMTLQEGKNVTEGLKQGDKVVSK